MEGYLSAFSETLGGASASVLYPEGQASNRYVFYNGEGNKGCLFFERSTGKKAWVEWALPLEAKVRYDTHDHIDRKTKGTLRRFLAYAGYHVVRSVRMTLFQLRALDTVRPLALYDPDTPIEGPHGCYVDRNGTLSKSKADNVPDLEITASERRDLQVSAR